MITCRKIAVYQYFDGDIDGWVRMASIEQKQIISEEDWRLIESLLQDMYVINNGNASALFMEQVGACLSEHCEKTAIEMLHAIAAQR